MKKIRIHRVERIYILIDNEDFILIKNSRIKNNKKKYARVFNEKYPRGIQLHRLIMNPPKGYFIDHINHNGLDNRKKNLRICTHAQNMHNTLPHKKTKSGLKGVCSSSNKYKNKKWEARIVSNHRLYHLGRFKYKKEAALAYNKKAIELFGEFAYLNKIY